MEKLFIILFVLLMPALIYAGDEPKKAKPLKIAVSAQAHISATIIAPVTTDWLKEKPGGEAINNYSVMTICESDPKGQEFEVIVINCE